MVDKTFGFTGPPAPEEHMLVSRVPAAAARHVVFQQYVAADSAELVDVRDPRHPTKRFRGARCEMTAEVKDGTMVGRGWKVFVSRLLIPAGVLSKAKVPDNQYVYHSPKTETTDLTNETHDATPPNKVVDWVGLDSPGLYEHDGEGPMSAAFTTYPGRAKVVEPDPGDFTEGTFSFEDMITIAEMRAYWQTMANLQNVIYWVPYYGAQGGFGTRIQGGTANNIGYLRTTDDTRSTFINGPRYDTAKTHDIDCTEEADEGWATIVPAAIQEALKRDKSGENVPQKGSWAMRCEPTTFYKNTGICNMGVTLEFGGQDTPGFGFEGRDNWHGPGLTSFHHLKDVDVALWVFAGEEDTGTGRCVSGTALPVGATDEYKRYTLYQGDLYWNTEYTWSCLSDTPQHPIQESELRTKSRGTKHIRMTDMQPLDNLNAGFPSHVKAVWVTVTDSKAVSMVGHHNTEMTEVSHYGLGVGKILQNPDLYANTFPPGLEILQARVSVAVSGKTTKPYFTTMDLALNNTTGGRYDTDSHSSLAFLEAEHKTGRKGFTINHVGTNAQRNNTEVMYTPALTHMLGHGPTVRNPGSSFGTGYQVNPATDKLSEQGQHLNTAVSIGEVPHNTDMDNIAQFRLKSRSVCVSGTISHKGTQVNTIATFSPAYADQTEGYNDGFRWAETAYPSMQYVLTTDLTYQDVLDLEIEVQYKDDLKKTYPHYLNAGDYAECVLSFIPPGQFE